MPDPIQTMCTRWGSDPLCCGSYSHVRVGSSGSDYNILAENVGGRLFFAGEATNREHPATMHGAFLSGLREASCILQTRRKNFMGKSDSKKLSQKNLRSYSEVLADLFKEPDLAFGVFSFVFDPSEAEDPKALGLMRVTFGNYSSRKELDEHRQSSEPPLQEFYLYALISREQAHQMKMVSDNDKGRLELLCKKFGIKLMGYTDTCALGSSLIISISGARRGRNRKLQTMHQKIWS